MVFGADQTVKIVIQAVDKFSKTFNKVNTDLKNTNQAVQRNFGEIAKSAKIAGTAITGMGIALGAVVVKGVEEASNLQESVNAVNVVFGEGSDVILEFGKNSARAVGLATSEFNQMSAVTGALLKDIGLPMDEVAGLTTDLTLRAADLASVFNTDVNDAMSAINQALRGETEAIRRYAGDVTDATLEQFLMSKGINKSVKELTQIEKRMFRVQLIMEQTANVQGDFANTSESLANRQRILRATFKNLQAEMSTALLPVFELFVGIIQKAVDWFSGLSDTTKKWIGISLALAAGLALIIGPILLLIGFLPALIAGFGTLSTVSLPLTGTILAIVAGVIALITASVLLWKKWDTLEKKTKILLAVMFPMITLPILILKNWDKLKFGIASIWNNIVKFTETGVNRVINAINVLIRGFNRIAGKLGFSGISEIGNVSFGEAVVDLASLAPAQGVNSSVNQINIENVYGTDPDEMAEALNNKLKNMISV